MKRGLVVFFILVFAVPLVSSISLRELIDKYIFSVSTIDMDLTTYLDYMIDGDNDGISDTLVLELTSANKNGNFIFVINLFDKNGVITNETNLTLEAGINKINITFDSSLLSQSQFNYSIKVYNSTYSLKYRKDKILTQNYSNFEEGFKVQGIEDSSVGNNILVSLTINSTVIGTFESILFLTYNDSTISIKENKTLNYFTKINFTFDNETIKRTHYAGRFNISSMKIGKKILRTDFVTNLYDFRNFASSSYLDGFSDGGYDSDGNGKFELLQIKGDLLVLDEGYYSSTLYLYDLFGEIVDIRNSSAYLFPGKRTLQFDINGSRINEKKLNGPFLIKRIELFENGNFVDALNDAYITGNYNFDEFDNPNLPDLFVDISVSQDYHYGINNISINFSFRNIGDKPAFNVFTEIFDNGTFSKFNKTNILNSNSELKYRLFLENISDFEITALADSTDLVEESDENNNAQKLTIKINKRPILNKMINLSANETDKIIINLSAFDADFDDLDYSINLSQFSKSSNIFVWNTTTNDSGNYTIVATVSDEFLNDSKMFTIVITDTPDINHDKSGIVCVNSVKGISVTCEKGLIVSNITRGTCRTIVCSDGTNRMQARSCDKPDFGIKKFYEVYKQSVQGTPFNICFGNVCVKNNGYAKSTIYPICLNQNIPQQNQTQPSQNQTNQENTTASANLYVKQFYPKGRDYVFVCNSSGITPLSYDWLFGDGAKQLNSKNKEVFHRFRISGNYTVECRAKTVSILKNATLVVNAS
ncbi:MAG TPA: CARDB domain-containing protein [Candidatus Nanoarchaeia archaeon]|nr:CARDB domain-containing protein [Candidatus Nanoarchaeia archaeon]